MSRRRKRATNAKGKWWSESQRIEAVTTWLALGTIPLTAAATNIPKDTLTRWRYTDWWKELVEQIRCEENLQVDARLGKIVNRTLSIVEDRLENGNFQYDQKSGELVRVPVNLRDTIKVTADLMDRRDKIRSQEQTQQIEQGVQDRLKQLADQFTKFAKPVEKDITPQPLTIENHATQGTS